MLTALVIGIVTIGGCAAVAVATHDGKDHTSEMENFERDHPYTSWEMTQPYNP